MTETMWRCDQVRAGQLYNRMMFDTREEAERFVQRMQQMEAPMVLHYATGEENQAHFDFIDTNAVDYAQQIREQGQRVRVAIERHRIRQLRY